MHDWSPLLPETALPRPLQDHLLDQEDFLDLLGHELRNPLAPIHNAVHLLRRAGGDPELLESACAIVERQASHLSRLVDDLVDLSRIARGKLQLHPETIDLVDAARRALAGCRPALAEKELTLEVDLPEPGIWLEADPARLDQALGSLLLQAIRCAAPGSLIRLEVQADPGGWGQVRVRTAGEPAPQGLGLDLALVQGLAALHGGTVQGRSDGPGLGSELTLRLPCLQGAQAPRAQPAPPAEGGGRQARRILIVEDLFDAAITMELLLEMLGHTVEIAADGAAGLEKARSFAPDIILCDIGLPGRVDGYELARIIRGTPALARTYLIALTGFDTAEDKDRARRAGFDLHLTKPIDPAGLEPLIARIP